MMKTLLISLCLLAAMIGTSSADTRYVSDTLVVTVRDQPDNTRKILTTVHTGDPLIILEDQKNYLKIRTAEGIEGYVRSQYVSKELPKVLQIEQLKTTKAQLQQKIETLSADLNNSVKKTKNLAKAEEELTRIKKEYQRLQKASANVLQITHEKDQLQQENSDLTGRLEQLKEENSIYLRTGVIKWFLAGAGVLFVGWLLGKISRKKKHAFR